MAHGKDFNRAARLLDSINDPVLLHHDFSQAAGGELRDNPS